MRCKHCGVGLSYYSSIQHAHRNSCQVSESGYHYFVTDAYYFVYTVYASCMKKPKDASYPIQTPLRDRVPNGDNTG